MKKIILGFTICLLILIPLFVFSSPSLGYKLKGKILLAVEDKGKTYYVHSDGNRYLITRETAQKVFEKLSLGIKNSDLVQIPVRDLGVTTDSSSLSCSSQIIEKIVYREKVCNCSDAVSSTTKSTVAITEETENAIQYSSYKPSLTSYRYSYNSSQGSNYLKYKNGLVIKFSNPTSHEIVIKKMEVDTSYNPSASIYFSGGKFIYNQAIPTGKNVFDETGINKFSYSTNAIYIVPPQEIIIYSDNSSVNSEITTDFSGWMIWDNTENKQVNQYN